MAISINPVEVYKLFRDRGISKKSEVADYLDIIAEHATQLANRWVELADQEEHEDGDVLIQLGLNRLVREHYERASSVVAGRLSERKAKQLFDSLEGISSRPEIRQKKS